jgi:23S rRNA (cytosine1962-C5)-methyltransferase
MRTVTLRRKAESRVRSGHLWIFSNELEDGFQEIPPGELAEVVDFRGRFIGIGTVNPHSLITVRLLSHAPAEINELWIRQKFEAALNFRTRLFGVQETAYRAIFSEADGLPGLVVDRFDNLLVLQSSTAGMDQLLPIVVPVLVDLLQPVAVIAANDSPMREREGLALSRELVWGEWAGHKIFVQDGIQFIIDPIGGQKTSFYFDQRFNRQATARFVRSGNTVLDLFCYTGGFGLYALQAGAAHVTFADASEPALEIARETVTLNGWSDRADFLKTDIFPFLRDGTQPADIVMVDPPALAKARTKVPAALRAYRDLNSRAMESVNPGGLLVTTSCSGLVQSAPWFECLREGAFKANRRLRILHKAGQSPDHPILSSMPETEYLKFAIGSVD